MHEQRIVGKQSSKQFQLIIISKPNNWICLKGDLWPEHGLTIVSVQVSPFTSVLYQLPNNLSIPRRRCRTYWYLKRILFLRLQLLIRLQYNFALMPIILASTVTACRQQRHHLTVTGPVHEYTATGSTLTSRQGTDVSLSLTDETELLQQRFLRNQAL